MLLGEALERVFCVDCFVRCEVLVHVNVREIACVVHEHRRLRTVGCPFAMGTKPGTGDSSWSMLTTAPGTVVSLSFGSILCVHHGFW